MSRGGGVAILDKSHTTNQTHTLDYASANTSFYNQRIKIYSNGEVRVRTYHSYLEKKSNDKNDSLDIALNDYEKIEFLNGWIYNGTGKLVRKSELSEKIKKDSIPDELKEIRSDSLSRTRNSIYDYVQENSKHWKSFVTLTFADNVTDVTQANKMFNDWCKKFRRSAKTVDIDFMYIGVPEFQKRGAVHYHLLTNIPVNSCLIPPQREQAIPPKLVGEIKKVYSEKKKKWFTCYNVAHWDNGFSQVLDFNECDDQFNPVLYMMKYLYKGFKDDNRLFGRKKILKSNNLKKPKEVKIIKGQYDEIINYLEYLTIENKAQKKEFTFLPQEKYQTPFNELQYHINHSNIIDFYFVLETFDKNRNEISKFNYNMPNLAF